MRFLTDYADQAVILPLAIAVGLALLLAGWRRGALAWAITVPATLGAMLIAKIVVHSCIAAAELPDLRSPSGHTASAAVVYGGLIALLLPAPAKGVGRLVAALLLGAGFAVVFGGTRLALHVHTWSDVVAGACFGVAGALALTRLAGAPPAGLRVAVPLSAALAVAVLFHGTHLHAEEAIDRLSCRLWSGPIGQLAAAPLQAGSARPYESFQPHHVVLAEIAARLHLDQCQRNPAGVFQPMHAADRQIDAFVLAHQHGLAVARHQRAAVAPRPMLGAVEMLLQRQFLPRLHHDALDLEAVAQDQGLVEPPGPIDAIVRHRLVPPGRAQPVDHAS